jgi:aspartyl/glutamyl-tRNA(Asn/Gln) amidotransferase C subunit
MTSGRTGLGPEDVRRIADLARLRIEASEIPALVDHFSRMLLFVDSLAEADDPSLPPWQLEAASAETLREDRPRVAGESGGPIPPEAWRGNAPESDGPWFTVPRVVG